MFGCLVSQKSTADPLRLFVSHWEMLCITLLNSFGIFFTYIISSLSEIPMQFYSADAYPWNLPQPLPFSVRSSLASLAIWTTLPKKMVWTPVSKTEDGLDDQLVFVCSDVRDVVCVESGKKKKKCSVFWGKKKSIWEERGKSLKQMFIKWNKKSTLVMIH